MMPTDILFCDLEQGPATIRALRSLTLQHADMVTRIVDSVGGGWSVTAIDDYDGYLSIIVEPENAAYGLPSYLISGTVAHIELAQVQGDSMRAIDAFDSITKLVSKLPQLLSV